MPSLAGDQALIALRPDRLWIDAEDVTSGDLCSDWPHGPIVARPGTPDIRVNDLNEVRVNTDGHP